MISSLTSRLILLFWKDGYVTGCVVEAVRADTESQSQCVEESRYNGWQQAGEVWNCVHPVRQRHVTLRGVCVCVCSAAYTEYER